MNNDVTLVDQPGDEGKRQPAAKDSRFGNVALWGSGAQVRTLVRDYGTFIPFVAIFIWLAIDAPSFLSLHNIANLLDQNSGLGIVACGATIVMIAGSFDLSLGAIFALSGIVAVDVANAGSPVEGFVAGIAVGAAAGLLNGVLVTVFRVNAFLATLATTLVFGGICTWITGGFEVNSNGPSFAWIGTATAGDFTASTLIFFGWVIVTAIVLSLTVFGRHTYAVGGNAEAARLAGIQVNLIRTATFVLGGTSASLAGVISASRFTSGNPDVPTTLALNAIAAVVIGGTSLFGGSGAIWRTVVGVLFLGMVVNGFNLLNWLPFTQDIATGAIIVIAVALNTWTSQRSR
ncbi:MAG TPA: ABC transporter permease [Solirubrobacteraceae bacterium]|jgi:ribose transport system permease protein